MQQTYEKMIDSEVNWLGDVPSEWPLKSMRYIFEQTKTLVGEQSADYKLLSLTRRGIIPRSEVEGGKNPEKYDTYQVVDDNDLIMCLFDYDVTPRTVGRATQHGMITGAYTVLEPKEDVSTRFYNYFFLALDESKELLHLCTGLRNGLSKPTFFGLKVPAPDYSTQEKIADFLDTETAKIDNLIAKQEKLLQLLEEKRRATITHAVTRGLNPNSESGWKSERLRYICEISPSSDQNFVDEDVVSFYPMDSIGDDGSISHKEERVYKEVKNGYTVFQNGDITLAKVTPCFENYKGALMKGIRSEVGFGSTELFVLRVKRGVLPEFLYQLTQSSEFNGYLTGGMRGTGGLKRVVPEELKNYTLQLPDIDEQQRIVDYINKANAKNKNLRKKVKTQITILKERRTSLISHAVTGKIKV